MIENWNKIGLIPGPGETKENFEKRATFCLNLNEELAEHSPFTKEEMAEKLITQKAFEKTKTLFDIRPTWVPIFISNHKLPPWQGGAAWIFQLKEDSPTAALIQLKKNPPFHSKEEILSHELVHAARSGFEEKKFEEFLAYQTSTSWFRKTFGPLFESAWESLVLLLLFAAIVILDLVFIFNEDALKELLWLKLLPVGFIGLLLFRLYRRHRTFQRCKRRLEGVTGSAMAMILRLTDEEIARFAKGEDVHAYSKKQDCLRWQVIKQAYL
jgi:hypothetical protein